jgi:hypothetical protein
MLNMQTNILGEYFTLPKREIFKILAKMSAYVTLKGYIKEKMLLRGL